MEEKVANLYKFTKIFNENLKKRYVPNILSVSKENRVNKTTEAYCKTLINYYSNKLAIKPVKK